MKKLLFVFFALLAGNFLAAGCDNQKTYAEMLEEEKKGIQKFIAEQKIKVISLEDFLKDTVTRCAPKYPGENEYVLFEDNGVYMQIVDRGTGDTIKNRDEILVRFVEYSILEKDTTLANIYIPDYVDDFYYTISGTTSYGTFISGMLPDYLYSGSYSNYNVVPIGWLVPLRYIRNRAHVRLIVPSKSGHGGAQGTYNTWPYYYDMRKIQIR